MDEKLKKEIFGYFKPMQVVYLATTDMVQSYVRPVTLMYHDTQFWIATGSVDAKMKQIQVNPNCQFCLTISGEKATGYIRASVKIEVIEDIKTKKVISDNFNFIKEFWPDPADPGYALLHCRMTEIEYLPIGEMLAEKFKF